MPDAPLGPRRVRAREHVVLETREARPGLNELRAEVQWSANEDGHRFFHVRHDPVPPAVSEAIEATVLRAVSNGRQKMTGHATLPAVAVALEVWSDVDVEVLEWSLDVRLVDER